MAEAISTRRGVLGAMAGVTLAAAAGVSALPARGANRSEWEAALARHRAAWEKLERHPVHGMLHTDPGYGAAYADEMECVRQLVAATAAVRATPAPDLKAVVEKLQFHLEVSEDEDGLIEAAIVDIRRLEAN